MFSIIIPTYNRNQYLNMCVKSIKHNFDKIIKEIVIVDDGSNIPVSKTLNYSGINKRKFKIIRVDNKGPACARNIGIKNSVGDYLIFLDDDCTLEKNFIKNLKKIIKNGNLEIIESNFLDPYKNNIYNKTWYLNYLYQLNKSLDYGKKGKYVKFLGNCYIIKRKLFDKIGLFDDKLITREDADFVLRVSKKNIPILLFYDLKIKHYSRNNLFATLKQFYNYGKGQVLLNKKWKNSLNKNINDNILDFLDYLKGYSHKNKIKYALIIRNIGYQCGIITTLLKSFEIRKSLNELLNMLLHIKKVCIGR